MGSDIQFANEVFDQIKTAANRCREVFQKGKFVKDTSNPGKSVFVLVNPNGGKEVCNARFSRDDKYVGERLTVDPQAKTDFTRWFGYWRFENGREVERVFATTNGFHTQTTAQEAKETRETKKTNFLNYAFYTGMDRSNSMYLVAGFTRTQAEKGNVCYKNPKPCTIDQEPTQPVAGRINPDGSAGADLNLSLETQIEMIKAADRIIKEAVGLFFKKMTGRPI